MFTIDFNDKATLYEQLYIFIRNEIVSGSMSAGEKLPSKRSLAAHLKISVVTVETAYSQLLSEGYIYSVPGSGFYVEALPDRITSVNKSFALPSKSDKTKFKVDFRTNRVDTDYFPFSIWAKLSREILSTGSDELLQSCDGKGVIELRQAIADYLREFRGMNVFPEQIVVGAGGEYLTGLLVQLLGRDKIYGVENPGYINTYKVFQANCESVVPIEMDRFGASVESLIEQNIQVAHITPSHHFPLGTVMPATRRHNILAWAEAAQDRYIIEDDYDSDFRMAGRPTPTLQSMDICGKVVYLNTFTKSLAPSMRIGYMVLPGYLVERLDEKLGFYACTVPVFEQLILAEFMTRGYFERHINRMRKLYLGRRDFFIKALKNSKLSESLEITGANAGMHLMLSSKNNLSESELISAAVNEGVRVYGLSEYYAFGSCEQKSGNVILGYSGLSNEKLTEGIKALEKAWL